MNFNRLLKKYGVTLTAVVDGQEGYWDTETGQYVPPSEPSEQDFKGIWLTLNDDELRYDEGGTFTFEDRKLIAHESIKLKKGENIKRGDESYKIDRSKPYDTYSNFAVYYCKRVTT